MSRADKGAIFESYRNHAGDIGRRFQEVDAAEFVAPVAGHLPARPSDILDLGAGSGRDAVWFARQGHTVVAVEPVMELAGQASALPGGETVEWHVDSLPDVSSLNGRDLAFDLVWLCAVWHHLDGPMREATLARIARFLRPDGRFILSLRQSDDNDGTLTFDADPDGTIALATDQGFELVDRREASSAQTHNKKAGVRWIWLVLDRAMEASR